MAKILNSFIIIGYWLLGICILTMFASWKDSVAVYRIKGPNEKQVSTLFCIGKFEGLFFREHQDKWKRQQTHDGTKKISGTQPDQVSDKAY